MNKSKKAVSGLLAIIMLVSMLACFALPAAAASGDYYYVSNKSEWNNVAAEINGTTNGGAGKTIYILADINFGSAAPTQITKFAGTLDGKGYKFTNIAMSSSSETDASLIGTLTGTIQNLTLADSCNFTNSASGINYWISTRYVQFGAFAAIANGGTIQKCASYATYTATGQYAKVGGFIGEATGTTTIDGCIFDGVVTGSGTGVAANAFVGAQASGVTATVKHSIARGTLTAATTGIGGSTITNSYAVNTEGNAWYSSNTKDTLNEAVWTINEDRKAAESGVCSIYLNVDSGGVPCFGDANNRVVQVSIESDGEEAYEYYAPRQNGYNSESALATTLAQNYFDLDENNTWAVTGAERRGNRVYIDDRDITVTSGAAAANETETANTSSETENSGEYTSIQNYDAAAGITDYEIKDAADWMKAVELSNHVTNPDATNFSGVTLHLTANINLADQEVLPLGYGGYFDGNLNGHDHYFYNLHMEIDSPYGPVGLIGVLGETAARTVQNVGIESGSIKVTGQPRYKYDVMSITSAGNDVGGIVGYVKYYDTATTTGSLIRKCWNNADITVENDAYVAGILGEGRNYAIIDSCINQGNISGYGILGYGHNRALTYNSMSGAVHKQTVGYRGGITGINTSNEGTIDESTVENNIESKINNVSGVKLIVGFSAYTSGVSQAQEKAAKDYNFKHSVMSNAAAAWTVNNNYKQQTYGDGARVYYTLDENGEVRFGDKENQICRIEMVCECAKDENGECAEHPTRYAYGVAKRPIALNFDLGANYYACAESGVSIEGNTLTFERAPKAANDAKENTFTVHVGIDADRGDVKTDGAINVLDVLSAVQMVAGNKDENLLTADVNSDHVVDINDAYQIIRYVFNMKEADATPFEYKGESEDAYLKVLSYNVKGLYYDPTVTTNDSSIGAALSRKDEVVAELNAADADIMGFQEIISNHSSYTNGADGLEEIYKGLTWYDPNADIDEHMHHVPTKTYSSGGTAGNGIISRYPIITFETVKFEGLGQIDDPTNRLDDTNGAPRAFTWYKIDLNNNGVYDQDTDIIFYNCHLAIVSDDVAAAEIQYIVQYMKDHHSDDRVVCAGDMNLGAYYTETVLNKVNDSNNKYTALNGGENYNTYARTNPYSGSMIDNIIVSDNVEYFRFAESALSGAPGLNTSAQFYDVNGNPVEGITFTDTAWTASDHMPIWACIKK